jgi:hypothetical protein
MSKSKYKGFSKEGILSQYHYESAPKHYYQSDIDFVMYKFINNEIEIVAFIEEKDYRTKVIDLNNSQFKLYRKLSRNKPLFCVIPFKSLSLNCYTFYVIAANRTSSETLLKTIGRTEAFFSEERYNRLLAYLRKERYIPDGFSHSKSVRRFDLPKIIKYKDNICQKNTTQTTNKLDPQNTNTNC